MAKIKEPYHSFLQQLLSHLRRRFREDLVSVAVYGSLARGNAKSDSDVDILILIRNLPKGIRRRQALFSQVEEGLESAYRDLESRGYCPFVSPVLKTPEEAEQFSLLYLDIIREAIVLYDRNETLGKILRRKADKLTTLGAKRVPFGSGWYWVLRPDAFAGKEIDLD